jgi:hypothetical protein
MRYELVRTVLNKNEYAPFTQLLFYKLHNYVESCGELSTLDWFDRLQGRRQLSTGCAVPPHRRKKLNLSSCRCSDRGGQIVTRHVGKFGKGWQSPKVCWALVPRRIKIGSHCKSKEWMNLRNVASLKQQQK